MIRTIAVLDKKLSKTLRTFYNDIILRINDTNGHTTIEIEENLCSKKTYFWYKMHGLQYIKEKVAALTVEILCLSFYLLLEP